MDKTAIKEKLKSMIGSKVTMYVDRPLGSTHPKHKDIVYEVNYGYIKEIIALDGDYQDAYLLGVDKSVQSYEGIVYAIVRQSGAPYHVQDRCFLCKKELKFYKERREEVVDLVKRADFTTLQQLPEDGVSAVTVVLYSSPRSGFCAAQVFEYEEMEMHSASDLVIRA